MLVTIKNTFIDVVDTDTLLTSRKPRSRSFHFEGVSDFGFSIEDSLSTAPTVCSPPNHPNKPFAGLIIEGIGSASDIPHLEKKIDDLGLLGHVANIESVKSGTEQHPVVSITMKNPDYAMSLFQLLHGEELGGFIMRAHLGFIEESDLPMSSKFISSNKESPRRGALTTTKLFVGGLKSSTHSRALKEYMQQFGPVKDCGIVYDFKGVSRRFGYCEYWSEESVLSVLDVGQHYIDSQVVGIRPYRLRE